ncbi:diaminopimelate epimerase [Geitlerinema sp. PCC 9228]|jgi:diaminopimelate epimerase|uniref:diaminopimelate epimerase n=1 Tax=Geitlerinema sp. PCC 9228 TaxID=111611 RepID=UPI0008F9ADC1|nr:diaminopimelate epimerase [Geitlerinema sp. PCC 9228]
MEFIKYQGLGNDFILIDNRQQNQPLLAAQQAIQLCDRHFGIGADGVIFLLPPQADSDCSMRIYNADGSEPQMCGNGIRCLAKFAADLGVSPSQQSGRSWQYRIHTPAGMMIPELLENGNVRVNMGMPRLTAREIPTTLVAPDERAIATSLEAAGRPWQVTAVSMGNPHCIIFTENADEIALETIGPQLENHPAFPERTNTEFVEIVNPSLIKMRVWERGAGATLACGTGACACVVAGVLNHLCDRNCTVELPGGPLDIEWCESDNRVYMSGPAEAVFTGRLTSESTTLKPTATVG